LENQSYDFSISIYVEQTMARALDETKLPSHGLFFMEGIGGCPDHEPQNLNPVPDRVPGCFGFEEERGEQWTGAGSASPAVKEKRPTL
jgi:hypothetical protein